MANDASTTDNLSTTLSPHKRIRSQFKKRYADELHALKQTDAWAEFVKRFGLDEFDFIIAQPQHRDRLVALCTDTFAQSNPMLAALGFTSSAKDKELQSEEFRFLLEESGSSVLAIHSKSGAIAGHICTKDVCDMADLFDSITLDEGSPQKYIAELMAQLYEGFADGDSAEYGKTAWGGKGFVVNRFQGSPVFEALMLLMAILPYRLGYDSLFGEAFHIQVLRTTRRFGFKTVNRLDLNKVRFEDGRTMRGFIEKSKLSKRSINSLCVELMEQNLRVVFETDKYGDRAVENFLRRQSDLLMLKAKL